MKNKEKGRRRINFLNIPSSRDLIQYSARFTHASQAGLLAFKEHQRARFKNEIGFWESKITQARHDLEAIEQDIDLLLQSMYSEKFSICASPDGAGTAGPGHTLEEQPELNEQTFTLEY